MTFFALSCFHAGFSWQARTSWWCQKKWENIVLLSKSHQCHQKKCIHTIFGKKHYLCSLNFTIFFTSNQTIFEKTTIKRIGKAGNETACPWEPWSQFRNAFGQDPGGQDHTEWRGSNPYCLNTPKKMGQRRTIGLGPTRGFPIPVVTPAKGDANDSPFVFVAKRQVGTTNKIGWETACMGPPGSGKQSGLNSSGGGITHRCRWSSPLVGWLDLDREGKGTVQGEGSKKV